MDLIKLINKHTDVSLAIARHVSMKEMAKRSNLVISPLSLNVVVGLIAAGASGRTLKQLLSFLKSRSVDDLNRLSSEIVSDVTDGSPSGGTKLSMANAMWIQEDLPYKPSYQRIVQSFYKADYYRVDFLTQANEIVSEVNSWAEKQTNGLIKEVVMEGSVDETTKLILSNAIYFKGVWEHKWFDASNTEENDFYLLGGSSVKVPFMTSNLSQYIRVFDSFKVLRLPYIQSEDKRKFSMYIFLPDSADGLPELVDKLGSGTRFLDQHLPHRSKIPVNDFRLPKFKFSFGFDASDTMKELGASAAFTSGGLTEMVDSDASKDLYVSGIFQKAFIEVDEEGTEAAPVSTIVCTLFSAQIEPPPAVDFVADHPFMFLIREDATGVVLFIGHVLNPLQE